MQGAGDCGFADYHREVPAPHLLYTAWGYPPSRGSGVYRAWATANAFASDGWDVTVLTAPRDVFELSTGVDLTLEERIDPSIEVVRVPFSSPAFDNDISSWSRARAYAPELWNGLQSWRGRRHFPERNYGGWRRALEAAAREVHRHHPVDVAIGTANPNVDFLPGYALHRSAGVPYVMDHRDAWSLDMYSGRRALAPTSRAGRWERRLMTGAHSVWFVNEPIREWHAAQHPDLASRFQVVQNGYDELLPDFPTRADRSQLVFGYIGTISNAVPLAELVTGWARARSRSPLLAAARLDLYGHLNHMGAPGDSVVAAMSSFGENAIRYLGPVARGDIGNVYAGFDALVLTFGSGRYITGGKVYEYASTGLPIVSVHSPENETSNILADHPGWTGTRSMQPDDIADAFVRTAQIAVDQTADQRRAAREHALRFSRAEQLAPAIAQLRAAVGATRRAAA